MTRPNAPLAAGLGASRLARGIARLAWIAAKLGVRYGAPVAMLALASRERRDREILEEDVLPGEVIEEVIIVEDL